jgi:transcriptional regulator with XRE-family HTH domain
MFLLVQDIDMDGSTFSERLADAMREAGITAVALSAATGMSQSAISQWLSSKIKQLSAGHLFAVADVLGVEPRWLLTGQGPRKPRLPPDLSGLTEHQIAAIRALLDR